MSPVYTPSQPERYALLSLTVKLGGLSSIGLPVRLEDLTGREGGLAPALALKLSTVRAVAG
jgi:hypothetical protein